MGNGSRTARRIAFLLQYDGTEFNGWQIQDNGNTIQGAIEKALGILTKEDVRVTASGRMDTGVHALGQVAHFDTSSSLSLQRLVLGMNGILSKNVSVINAFEVPEDFHSRFSAREREYVYRIYNGKVRSPFMMYRAMWVNFPLDINYVNESLGCLIGEKDFASFCKKKSADEGTVREILEAAAVRKNEYLEIKIRGNAFLHNMIRIIIGTVVDNFKNRREPGYMKEILDAADRDAGGPTAPPFGLYLNKIEYDPPLDAYKRAFL